MSKGLIIGVATRIIWPWSRVTRLDAANVQSYQHLHEDTVVTKRDNIDYLGHDSPHSSWLNSFKVLKKFLLS